jgi:hypothetical protein
MVRRRLVEKVAGETLQIEGTTMFLQRVYNRGVDERPGSLVTS